MPFSSPGDSSAASLLTGGAASSINESSPSSSSPGDFSTPSTSTGAASSVNESSRSSSSPSPSSSPPSMSVAMSVHDAMGIDSPYAAAVDHNEEQTESSVSTVLFPQPASSFAAGKKTWTPEQRANVHAVHFAPDGTSITCGPCSRAGHGRTKGIIQSRHRFSDKAFISHCDSEGHKNLVNVEEFNKEKAKEAGSAAAKRQVSMMSSGFSQKIVKTNAAKKSKASSSGNGKSSSNADQKEYVAPPKRCYDCSGVMNSFKGEQMRKKEVTACNQYITIPPNKPFTFSVYAGLPNIRSLTCTGQTTIMSKDGPQCIECSKVRKMGGSASVTSWVKKRGGPCLKAEKRAMNPTLSDMDIQDAKSLVRVQDQFFTPDGLELKAAAEAQVEYYSHMKRLKDKLKNPKYRVADSESVPGVNSFISEFADEYENNAEFRESLVVALLKSLLCRLKTGNRSAQKEEKVNNFIRVLATHSKAASQFASANLGGISDRYMRKLNQKEREPCIYDSDYEDIIKRMTAAIEPRRINPSRPVAVSLAIDATKVAPAAEVSLGYKAIIGGEHPNHKIDIEGLSKAQIEAKMDGLTKATEVKVVVMSFQDVPAGLSPNVIVAARPQGNNDASSFVRLVEAASKQVMKTVAGARVLVWAVDGLSVESDDVRRAICDFLSGLSDILSTTDPCHIANK